MTHRIYLDYAATAPLLSEAREAMAPWLEREHGNASSLYEEGRRAKDAIDAAREVVASALGCLFGEVVFTSGGTEACNLAVVGTVLAEEDLRRNRVLVSAAEHHAVLNTKAFIERLMFHAYDPVKALVVGEPFSLVPVDQFARPDIDVLRDSIGRDVALVAAMHANNELGTITDVAGIAEVAHEYAVPFFCDAVQTFPWCNGERWTVDSIGADLVAVSAHKFGGPKGVGALYVKAGTQVSPLAVGGGQEREMRAGTENVAAIVGFAAALRAVLNDKEYDTKRARARDAFQRAVIEEETPKLHLLPRMQDVLPGHCHLRFEGVSAESLLILLDRMGVAASAGAACSSGSIEPSHVLLACGWDEEAASEGVRFTFGPQTSEEDAVIAAKRVAEAARNIGGYDA